MKDAGDEVSGWPGATQVLALGAILVVATVVGGIVRVSTHLTIRGWLGQIGNVPGLRRLSEAQADRLRNRWNRLISDRDAGLQTLTADERVVNSPDPGGRAADLHRAALRISLYQPNRPTWMGNRIHALEGTLKDHYDLNVYWVWPRVWMVLPEATRNDIATAHESFRSAATRAIWALPWLVLAFWWWPALPVSAVLALHGWRAARRAVDTLAQLAESAVDTHGPVLAVQLGLIRHTEPLTTEIGRRISKISMKNR